MDDQPNIIARAPAKWSVDGVAWSRAIFNEDLSTSLALFHQQGEIEYDDGSKGVSLRCPMLVATGYLANQPDILSKIADVLNQHFRGDEDEK